MAIRDVISEKPLCVNMRELVENLQVRNTAIKSARRMTRQVEKKETETILSEFKLKGSQRGPHFGFVKYERK